MTTGNKPELIRPVDVKIKRAQLQSKELILSIHNWIDANEFTARSELREGRLGYRLILNDFSVSVPVDEWGIAIGELIHNIRSALDNLAFALARLNKDPPENARSISFPIFEDKSSFEKNSLAGLSQMPTEAAGLITSLQPFQRNGSLESGTPENDPLLLIQWLSNSDKHRVPSVVLLAPADLALSGVVAFQNVEDLAANLPPDATIWAGPILPGSVLLEYRTKHPLASVSGAFDVKAVVALETNKGPMPVDEIIPKLGYYAELVIEHFRMFFMDPLS